MGSFRNNEGAVGVSGPKLGLFCGMGGGEAGEMAAVREIGFVSHKIVRSWWLVVRGLGGWAEIGFVSHFLVGAVVCWGKFGFVSWILVVGLAGIGFVS